MENYEMIWIIISASATILISTYLGYKRILYLHQLHARNLWITGVIGFSLFTFLIFLFQTGIMIEETGVAIISNFYASLSGFFGGSAFKQYRIKMDFGKIRYAHRTFLSDHAPIIIAIGIILFGLVRTAVFTDLPITPIRITSGLSLMAFGAWGMTIRLVPEFRQNGIILLDYKIYWKEFLNYEWFLEGVIQIEYNQNEIIKHFKTSIPPEDQLIIEDLLRSKMMEKVSDN